MAAEVFDALCLGELQVTDLTFGPYVAAIATDSIGYILVKDASGVARRWMIQA